MDQFYVAVSSINRVLWNEWTEMGYVVRCYGTRMYAVFAIAGRRLHSVAKTVRLW